jgi:hypothetical protein
MKRFLGLLLLTFMFVSPALAQPEDEVVFSPQSIVVNPKPGFEVDVFLAGASGGEVPTYQVGEEIRIGVRVTADSYVYLFNVRPNGRIQQLLPNRFDEAGRNNFLRAGETRYFPAQNARYTFNAEPPRGLDKVIAVASRTELDTRQLARFEGDPNFATSSLGEEGFARNLSIVVRPIEQRSWVTDTALLYVGSRPQQPAYGTLEVRANPRDSAVYVDGEFVGYTPVSYGTRPGRHEVRVERSGFETYQQTVNVRPGSTTTVDASLTEVRRTGRVSFESDPRDAEVYVDGRFVGTTPTGSIRLDAGRHEARFVRPGYRDSLTTFEVRAGESQTVDVRLRSQTGRLEIQANVGGARVYLDGSFAGTIPSGSGLLTLSDLEPGNYELLVVAPGFRSYMTEVRVEPGDTSQIRVRQERR